MFAFYSQIINNVINQSQYNKNPLSGHRLLQNHEQIILIKLNKHFYQFNAILIMLVCHKQCFKTNVLLIDFHLFQVLHNKPPLYSLAEGVVKFI